MPNRQFTKYVPATHGIEQRGVVLIVALIMLVVISLLATFSIRNATSTEAAAGNVRTTQLASQAAEIALRYCEDQLDQIKTASPTATIAVANIITSTQTSAALTKSGNSLTKWDTAASTSNWNASNAIPTSAYIIIPTTALGGTTTFQRSPECMIEAVQVLNSANVVTTTSTYLITARGFGPEVGAVDANRSRPTGSEIWLQSTLEY